MAKIRRKMFLALLDKLVMKLKQLIHCHDKVLLAELPTWYALDTALPVMMAMVTILKVFRNIEWQQLLPLLREDELEKGAEG